MRDIKFLYKDWCEYSKENAPVSFAMYCYQQGRDDAIDEYKNTLWEDIEARYKSDIKILGFLPADKLLRDVHNSICYFAKQLTKQ